MPKEREMLEQVALAMEALSEVSIPRLQGRKVLVTYRRGKLYLRLVREVVIIEPGVAGEG
jgi:hypothetical protein